ncbi:MAG: hypothetical protein ABMA13_22175 [Chthoniobacteraceae bacterium]
MDAASLLEFDDVAQADFEACYPASVTFPGITDPVACAGGAVRQLSLGFISGGGLGEFDLAFRVRKARLNNVPPEVGALITFQAKLWRIMRATDSAASVAYAVHCGNPNAR